MLNDVTKLATEFAWKVNGVVPNPVKIGVACAMVGASIGFAVSEHLHLKELKKDVDFLERAVLATTELNIEEKGEDDK